MADAIQNRKLTQENIQMLQQDKIDKKRVLAERQREEIKELRTKYKQLNNEIVNDTQAAINHIKVEAEEETAAAKAERLENQKSATYNRRGVQQNNNGEEVNQSSNRSSRSILSEKPTLAADKATKKENQFFKTQDIGSQISESFDGYTIETFAPEAEKDSFRMSIANNRAVLSGKRKFQDSVEDGIKKMSTNNFQTFHEEFKFDRPIDEKRITHERDGDKVVFFIPKLESLSFDEES